MEIDELRQRPVVAVIGGHTCTAEEANLAEAVGRMLAQQGVLLICGGRGGVMEAACRGAKTAEGITIGVLPGTDARDANPYVDIGIATGMGEARNAIIISSAQAVVAVGGDYGTLSEIALALKRALPVVGLGTWELTRRGKSIVEAIYRAESPGEAVSWVIEELKADEA